MIRNFLAFTTIALTSLAATWAADADTTLPALPRAATSFGAAVSDNMVYVYGGNTGRAHEFHRDCIRGDFLSLGLEGNAAAWKTVSDGEKLLSPALVEARGSIVRIGGMTARNTKEEPNDLHSTAIVESYSPVTGKWTPLPSLPEPRSSHDAVFVGTKLYVGGGWRLYGHSSGDWCKTLLSLDLDALDKGWQAQPQPFSRRALAMVSYAGKIWFLGGMDNDDKPSREVDWLNPVTGEWGKGPELPDGPMKGFGLAACAQSGHLYASPSTGFIYRLKDDASGWTEVTKLAMPRFFHRLLPLPGGALLALGGSGRQGHVMQLEVVLPQTPASAGNPEPAQAGASRPAPSSTAVAEAP